MTGMLYLQVELSSTEPVYANSNGCVPYFMIDLEWCILVGFEEIGLDMRGNKLKANILLLLTAVIWGGGFVAQRLGIQELGPYLFNGIRFLLGAITLIPMIFVQRRLGTAPSAGWKKTIGLGIAAGSILFVAATLQQLGLVHTTAGKAGFITGLYVIIVPMMGMLWGDRASLHTWLGAVLAAVGLYFLSITAGFQFAPGDGFVLLGAVFWAGHVQFLAKFSPEVDPFKLSFVQALFTALLSLAVGIATEPYQSGSLQAAFWPILYGGAITIGIAFTMQVIAQQSAGPTAAAIILSLESVFAAFWGWIFLNEVLSQRAFWGSGLMLAGMILSQLKFGRGPKLFQSANID